MKNERLFKSFSALSPDGNAVAGEDTPAPIVSQPRLTPESVQDFNVHQDGSADGEAPQPERSGAARHWQNGERCRWSFGKPVVVGWRCLFRAAAATQSKGEKVQNQWLQ